MGGVEKHRVVESLADRNWSSKDETASQWDAGSGPREI
jgi:hypothetical protein